jgi:hypothetical protein
MDKTFIQWNVVNWITITLMALLGVAAYGFASKMIASRVGGDAESE